MRRLGIVGRADYGGIAAQTLDVARNMQNVTACLVLDLGEKGRGPFDPTPWTRLATVHELAGRPRPEIRVARFPFTDEDLEWLLDRVDVVYEPEGPPPFRDDFPHRCAQRGIPFVIHVNPELWRDRYLGASTIKTLPTTWHQERHPEAWPLPMPCPNRDLTRVGEQHGDVLFHLAAPAMDDRNGTDLVRAALPFVTRACTLYTRGVTGAHPDVTEEIGKVRVVHLPAAESTTTLFPVDASTLVLPRRYGGLSLPMLEAAASGIVTITLDLPPQNTDWADGPFVFVSPYREPRYVAMIGGSEAVWDARPEDLAAAIDSHIACGPRPMQAYQWAESRSWRVLRPRWEDCLT